MLSGQVITDSLLGRAVLDFGWTTHKFPTTGWRERHDQKTAANVPKLIAAQILQLMSGPLLIRYLPGSSGDSIVSSATGDKSKKWKLLLVCKVSLAG